MEHTTEDRLYSEAMGKIVKRLTSEPDYVLYPGPSCSGYHPYYCAVPLTFFPPVLTTYHSLILSFVFSIHSFEKSAGFAIHIWLTRLRQLTLTFDIATTSAILPLRFYPTLTMRSFILIALVAIITFVSAMPITPAAPQWQAKAEQFRLQGLKEIEIAEKLMAPTAASSSGPQPFFSRLNQIVHVYIHAASTDDKPDLSGDIAPGSAEIPQILPTAPASNELSLFERLCAVFHRSESSFGYEGKESEMRRPIGSVYWNQFGGFRR
ncbi:hypothetical protein IAQ61_007252 [Plenodomus lingam]|uniref:uncharacterized protein n=1 Tax=Leptosphaeria maculans TaxID=5022 RepID=UPI003322B4AC|nr:hypothetical protein IAQ61_007252 [Plenodomus lingam]